MVEIGNEINFRVDRMELKEIVNQLNEIRRREGSQKLIVTISADKAEVTVEQGNDCKSHVSLMEDCKKACDEFAVAMETARAAAVVFEQQMMAMREQGLL
ncbi:MAG: hypothetical protein LKJ50_04595 [Clostridiales bacterium]|jgi:hypothetical protein|nr:hypothetical protein [Clostridiales bacterium]MCI1961218.1 hypothetical protein [Clostridiales bacterium]MCI2021659.1 hypothetical protein [Clostridiales bacterium]MCI2026445.1 hypothetical protein [Clostridiales bacterium]